MSPSIRWSQVFETRRCRLRLRGVGEINTSNLGALVKMLYVRGSVNRRPGVTGGRSQASGLHFLVQRLVAHPRVPTRYYIECSHTIDFVVYTLSGLAFHGAWCL
jgi:hypothetical protein